MKPYKNKIINLIFIFVVFSFGIQASAQINADSLESALKKANKKEKLTILNTLATYYLVISPGKTVEYSTQAISIADEIHDIPKNIEALLTLGNAYSILGYHTQSLAHFKQALDLAKSSDLQKEIALVSLKIGNYYNTISKYDEALKYDLDALRIYKTLDDNQGLSDTYHNIGIVYYYLGNLGNALEFNKNALEIREKLKDTYGISKSLNNTAMIYMDMNQNEKALEYYFKALKLMEELNSVSDQAITLSNIGITYQQLKDNNKALFYYLQSLDFYDKLTDNRNKSRLLGCMGNAYTDLKKYEKAENYFNQGLDLAQKSGYLDMIALNYKYLADLYLMTGNYKKTLEYKDLYFKIKDSVFNDQNQKRIAEFQVRIETDNTQREAQLIKEKSNLMYLFFILLAVTIIIIILILYSRHRTKHNVDIALNNLNFDNIEANISIEKLILWSNYQNGRYKICPDTINLSDEIANNIQLYKSFSAIKKLRILSSVPNDTIVHTDPTALNLITRFLIFNSIKNASEGSSVNINSITNGDFIELSIVYSALANKSVEISKLFNTNIQQIVSNKDKESGENHGLALCKEFIEISGGTMKFDTLPDRRVSFTITLSLKS